MDASLKNQVAVIGVGTTRYGSFPELDEYGLAAWAFRDALGECGIEKKLIDGLLVCRIPGSRLIQNAVYRWVANHRYRFPGTTPYCESHPVVC